MGPLESLLRERIAREGSISFRDFMDAALYHPAHGYYTASVRGFGAEGDFVTSPELHPVFGALLARQVLEAWEALGSPIPFRIREVGAGSGALAHALLSSLRAESPAGPWPELAYAISETSPGLRQLQAARLAEFDSVVWEEGSAAHVILANEVLDAQPTHRVVMRAGRLRELRVGLGEDVFRWVEEDAPPAALAYFERLGLAPPEGSVAEINLGLRPWIEGLADRLLRGLVLLIDYGATAEELFRKPSGTLLTYYRHTLGSDPLVRVGKQDISVHVDFTTVSRVAEEAGFTVLGLASQRAVLGNLGLQGFRARLRGDADARALGQLVDPRGLGSIKALFLAKGMPDFRPVGLAGGRDWNPPSWVPALPVEEPPEDFMRLWREAFGESDPLSSERDQGG